MDGWVRPLSLTENPRFGMRALCFISSNVSSRQAVIAFRGTDLNNTNPSGQADQCADALLWRAHGSVPPPLPAYCSAFANATLDYLAAAEEFVRKVRVAYPSHQLLFTGHSLGAGLAFLSAALLTDEHAATANAAQAVGDDVAHTKKPVVVAPCVAIASPPWLLTLRRRAPHTKLPPFATVRSHWLALADEWDPVQKDSAAVGGLFGTQCLWSSPEPAACALCFLKALPANMSRPTCRACFEQRHVYAHYVDKDVPGKRAVCQDV